jgi:hypothetical protein
MNNEVSTTVYECVFTFNKKDAQRYVQLSTNIFMIIKRVSNSVAEIYFTNSREELVDIPYSILVYDTSNDELVNPICSGKSFALSISDTYLIYYQNNIAVEIKQPDLTASTKYWVLRRRFPYIE